MDAVAVWCQTVSQHLPQFLLLPSWTAVPMYCGHRKVLSSWPGNGYHRRWSHCHHPWFRTFVRSDTGRKNSTSVPFTNHSQFCSVSLFHFNTSFALRKIKMGLTLCHSREVPQNQCSFKSTLLWRTFHARIHFFTALVHFNPTISWVWTQNGTGRTGFNDICVENSN